MLEELRPRIPAPPDGPPPAFRTPQVSTRKLAQERVGPRSLPDLRRARGAGGGGGGGGGGAGAPVTLMALQKKAVASLYLPAIETKRRPETVSVKP